MCVIAGDQEITGETSQGEESIALLEGEGKVEWFGVWRRLPTETRGVRDVVSKPVVPWEE